jgi:hypothetical protein
MKSAKWQTTSAKAIAEIKALFPPIVFDPSVISD